MSYEPTDPSVDVVIGTIISYIIRLTSPKNFFLATLTGLDISHHGRIRLEQGGFGLLQYKLSDQTITYSKYQHESLEFRRHTCNVWFANEKIGASPQEKWIFEIFSQDDEVIFEEVRDQLRQAAEGQIAFDLLRRREATHPERTLADFGLGVRK